MSPKTTPAVTPATKAAAAKTKAPARAPDAIMRDIAAEQAQLGKAFADLRDDLATAIDSAGNQATEIARKAMLVVPAMAVAVTATSAGLVGGVLALRRHRRK